MEPKVEIRSFVRDLLAQKSERRDVADDEPLVSAGLLDSLDIVTTVAFLEERFGVDFAVLPFDADRFDTITSIAGIVAAWTAGAQR